MQNSEKVKIEISIGTTIVPLSVELDNVRNVRDLEKELNNLFDMWRKDFPAKSEKELLAMIAYQYASYYSQLTERYKDAYAEAEKCDELLSSIVAPISF